MWYLGQRICHTVFGYGVVTKVGKDLLTIKFDDNTIRDIVPSLSSGTLVPVRKPHAQAHTSGDRSSVRGVRKAHYRSR
jgi:hypothetical protein